MKRGRPFEPGNKFGRGRPKGSRNKFRLIPQQLLDEYTPALMHKSLALALQGDVPLLRMLLGTKLPRPSDSVVNIGRLPTNTIEDLAEAQRKVCDQVTTGKITPMQGGYIKDQLESRRQFIETQELAKRVRTLEQLVESK